MNTNAGGIPAWAEAFSGNPGSNWEANWTMEFSRIQA